MEHNPPTQNPHSDTPNFPICVHCGEQTPNPCMTDQQADLCDNFSTYLSSALHASQINLNIPLDDVDI